MKTLPHLLVLPMLLLAACASKSAPDQSTADAAPTHKKLSERMNESNGYKQDANGNWKPQINRRSEFESKGQDPNFTKDFKKQEYKTGDYATKSWWGNKDYEKKSYAGNTDGSRFDKPSALQGKDARETDSTAKIPAPYKTGKYATGSAHEADTAQIKKTSNAITDNRQKVFKQPEIVDWKQQRSLSLDQSKGILGH